jgi:hypothetical protein
MSEMGRAARALVEKRSERFSSHHGEDESKARLAAALLNARAEGFTVFTPVWSSAEGRAVLEANFAPPARIHRTLQILSIAMTFAVAASAWAIASADGTLSFLLPLLTVFAILAIPFFALALGSHREAEEARIRKAIRVALLDETERLPPPNWKDDEA